MLYLLVASTLITLSDLEFVALGNEEMGSPILSFLGLLVSAMGLLGLEPVRPSEYPPVVFGWSGVRLNLQAQIQNSWVLKSAGPESMDIADPPL